MPISLGERFGAQVRTMRTSRRLTQDVLAERCGLSVDAIRRIERGAFSPSLETIGKLARGLGVSLRTLFESFELPGRERVGELSDYLSTLKPQQVRMADRVVRAMFEEDRGE